MRISLILIFMVHFAAEAQALEEVISKLKNSENNLENIVIIDKSLKEKIDVILKKEEIKEDKQILLYFRVKKMIVLLGRGSLSKIEQDRLSVIFDKSEDFDLDDYDFDDLQEKYEQILNEKITTEFHWVPYVYLSYITWNYSLNLTESTGEEASLYSKEKGLCVGGGYSYSNAYWGFSVDGCYAYMTATVGEDSKTIKYNQSNVAVDTIFVKTGVFWKPKPRVSVGFYPIINFHNGNYSPPVGGTLSEDNKFSFGYMIDTNWSWEKIKIHLGIGSLNNYPSSVWQLGMSYQF